MGNHHGSPAIPYPLRKVFREKIEALQRGIAARAHHVFGRSDDEPDIHKMNPIPVPGKVHPVFGNVYFFPPQIALAQSVDDETFALRPIVIPPHFAHRKTQLSIPTIQPPIRSERGPFRLLHRHMRRAIFVARVDEVTGVNYAGNFADHPTARLSRNLRAGQFVEPFDEPRIDAA